MASIILKTDLGYSNAIEACGAIGATTELFHDGPLPQHDLAFLTDRDKTSLTRLLSTMEKKNLVARITSSEDKRVNLFIASAHNQPTPPQSLF